MSCADEAMKIQYQVHIGYAFHMPTYKVVTCIGIERSILLYANDACECKACLNTQQHISPLRVKFSLNKQIKVVMQKVGKPTLVGLPSA